MLHGKHPWVKPPLITGHEMAGVVDAAAAACTQTEQPGSVKTLIRMH